MTLKETLIAIGLGLLGSAGIVFGIYKVAEGARQDRREAAQATASTNSATATQQAAQDALKITVDNQAVHGRIDVITSENTHAILNAPGADQAVDSALHSTGLRSLCMYAAYHDSDACRSLLNADPVKPAG